MDFWSVQLQKKIQHIQHHSTSNQFIRKFHLGQTPYGWFNRLFICLHKKKVTQKKAPTSHALGFSLDFKSNYIKVKNSIIDHYRSLYIYGPLPILSQWNNPISGMVAPCITIKIIGILRFNCSNCHSPNHSRGHQQQGTCDAFLRSTLALQGQQIAGGFHGGDGFTNGEADFLQGACHPMGRRSWKSWRKTSPTLKISGLNRTCHEAQTYSWPMMCS